MQASDMLTMLNVNGEIDEVDTRIERKRITINNDWMLKALAI